MLFKIMLTKYFQKVMNNMYSIKTNKLTKKFKERTAVNEVNLKIKQGELFALLGTNGAGKTTTIMACCGILSFDEGEIYIDGISVKDSPVECKRRLAYIPDNPDLYDFMTGIQYLNFVADIFGVGAAVRQERIRKYSELFGLTEDLSMQLKGYSHGMKQKLAVISALIHEPQLIIMDEPFVGLDPKAAHTLKGIMREICNSGGAIFFSTHVLEVAERLCDKVAIIKDGRLVLNGKTEEVRGEASLEEIFLELGDSNA